MKSSAKILLLALLAFCATGAAPLRAETNPPHNTFFTPQYYLGNDADGFPVYYLDYFGTYTYDEESDYYVYKYNFGWLYFFGGSGASGSDDAYFYDFNADDIFYTAPELYPYFYSFNLDSFLYYFEDSSPREFYVFSSGKYVYY